MPGEKTVILSSGGLNSAVMTSLAMRDCQVAAIHARFGQRAQQREIDLFERQADHFGVKERLIIDLPHIAAIGVSARVSRKRTIEDAIALSPGESNCFVPGLMGSLIFAAQGFARQIGATKIFLGVCENLGPPAPKTCSIYPDYSREFVLLADHILAATTPARTIRLEAPLIDMNRADIIRLGRRLETPFELTWSCISSSTQCCGACVGCATRNRGFLDAAIPDPLFLQPTAKAMA